jgi:hypothetical protein
MADELIFFGWDRAAGALAAAHQGGRLRATLNLKVTGDHPGEQDTAALTFEFHGAPDVTGLLPGAITHVSPAPGSTNAEETMCPYVELAAPDLPWRYTPEPRNGDKWRPWFALVVGPADQMALQGRSEVVIGKSVLKEHPLGEAAKWAHVQMTNPPSPAPAHTVSRLLSPYPLEPNTNYLAVVVPIFDSLGNLRWTGAAADAVVPIYHSWRFRTGDAGDFKDLALRLKTRPIDDPLLRALGRDAIEYPLPGQANVAVVRSALVPPSAVPVNGSDPDGPPPNDVAASIADMRLSRYDAQGRHVVQLPVYGEAWVADPLQPAAGWGASLNDNPRHRVAAGLGLWCGVAKQDLIADAAAARAAGLFIAAQRIRALTAGLAAAGSLWSRRLPSTPEARLTLFGPAFARMASVGGGSGGTVLTNVTDPHNGMTNGRPMPPALFSSAARRLLRPRTARSRDASAGALTPEQIVPAANKCERLAPILRPSLAPDGGRDQRGLPHADFLAASLRVGAGPGLLSGIELEALGRRLADAGHDRGLLDSISPHFWPDLLRALLLHPRPDDAAIAQLVERSRSERDEIEIGELGETLNRIGSEPPARRCRPVDLRALDAVLMTAFRPDRNGVAAARVLNSIDGLDPVEPFAPPEICPDLDLPAWRFLRDEGREWLLLGRNGIQPDDVVALGTNPRFINAFLTGLNTQALGELRWRNIPVKTGCTPLRRFWDRITSATATAPSAPATDIRGIALWNPAQPLGHADHSPDPSNVRQLVIVFRTDLFRRYPQTLVYLAAAAKTPSGGPDWMAPATFAPNVAPVFTGEIDPDLVFFGFPVKPEDLADRWIVVEEAPPGYRFRDKDLPPGETDGGSAAKKAFAAPTRVLFRGDQFLAGPS